MQDLNELAEQLSRIYATIGMEWEGYGKPVVSDLAVALAGMVDYLAGTDADAVELPNAHLKVTRDESGAHSVWLCVGELNVDSIPGPELSDDGQGGTEEPSTGPSERDSDA